jgi:hypothetical protein
MMWGVLASGAALAQSGTVVVLPASGTNVSARLVQDARAMLVERLSRAYPGARIVDVDRPPTALPPDVDDVRSIGRSFDADAVLVLSLERQPPAATLKVTRYGGRGQGPPSYLREVTYDGPEALPRMVEKIVFQLGPASPPPLPPGTPRSGIHPGFRASAFVPLGSAGAVDAVVPLGSLFVLADQQHFIVDVSVDFSLSSDVRATSVGVGAYVPLRSESSSPYLGACVKWSSVRLGGVGADGAALAPGLGWIGHRYRTGQLHAQLAYFVTLFQEQPYVARVAERAHLGEIAHGPQLWLGVSL